MHKYQKGLTPILIIILVIMILITIGSISYFLLNKNQVACTTEAKICSDGSVVGRTGPNCEFAACPELSTGKNINWEENENDESLNTDDVQLYDRSQFQVKGPSNLICYNGPKYFFVPGDNGKILIKYKENADNITPCSYIVGKNDFEFTSNGAEYFLAFVGDFLIDDSGTGPGSRGLIVYNLINRKLVYSDLRLGSISTSKDNNNIFYWKPTNKEVTNENCPELSTYTASGLGAEIYSYTKLELNTLKTEELGKYRCSATQ